MTRVSRQAIILAAVPSASLIAGTILHLGGRPELGDLAWNAGIVFSGFSLAPPRCANAMVPGQSPTILGLALSGGT